MSIRLGSRRSFLRQGMTVVAGATLAPSMANLLVAAPPPRSLAKVALIACDDYGPEFRAALSQSIDLLGGITALVKGKTVTVKLNLTGTNFADYLGRPVGETYMTHPATVTALCSLLFDAGAKRVRLVESTNSRAGLDSTLSLAGWDLRGLSALGRVEFENTRNLGSSKSYSHLSVSKGGYMFSSFDLNRAYEDTDVFVSLAKLKNHITAGVTLAMKNIFGMTPNSLYGDEAGSEDATAGRNPLHDPRENKAIKLPGLKSGLPGRDSTWRVPRIVADLCSARPIHLSIIDGVKSMSGGEGPWCGDQIRATAPGVLIVGLNPVSTDAVGTAVMGYENPRAPRGIKPFDRCDNHLLLAEEAGVGTADLSKIEVLGERIERVKVSYG